MRVLLLNYEYPPLGGGAGVATQALARGLASRGVTVDVITAGERDEHGSEVLWDGHAAQEGLLTVYRVSSRRTGIHQAGMAGALSYLRAALPLVRARMRVEHYDIVHLFFSLPTGAMLPFLNLGDTPVIVSLRGSDVPGYDPCQRSLHRAHRVLRPLTRWIWRRASRVVSVCESLGRLALRTDPRLRYSVIPNGVDLGRFRPSVRARSRHPKKVRCLAVARLVERKGVADLIQAIAALERGRYELEIVGSGPDEARLKQLARQLGVSHEVIFAGSLDRAVIPGRYRDADIFTLAPWEESFGSVFAEALASGLPIVGSAVGGIPELVEHGKNGFLVPPRQPKALAAAIRHLADHPEVRVQIGRWNRAQAEANLSWARVTTRYLSVYHGVLRRAPVRAQLTEQPSSIWWSPARGRPHHRGPSGDRARAVGRLAPRARGAGRAPCLAGRPAPAPGGPRIRIGADVPPALRSPPPPSAPHPRHRGPRPDSVHRQDRDAPAEAGEPARAGPRSRGPALGAQQRIVRRGPYSPPHLAGGQAPISAPAPRAPRLRRGPPGSRRGGGYRGPAGGGGPEVRGPIAVRTGARAPSADRRPPGTRAGGGPAPGGAAGRADRASRHARPAVFPRAGGRGPLGAAPGSDRGWRDGDAGDAAPDPWHLRRAALRNVRQPRVLPHGLGVSPVGRATHLRRRSAGRGAARRGGGESRRAGRGGGHQSPRLRDAVHSLSHRRSRHARRGMRVRGPVLDHQGDPGADDRGRPGPVRLSRFYLHCVGSLRSLHGLGDAIPGLDRYPERALLLAVEGDAVCVPGPVDPDYLGFLAGLGVGPRPEHVIVAGGNGRGAGRPLVERLMGEPAVLSRAARALGAREVTIEPYAATTEVMALAEVMERESGIPVRLDGSPRITKYADQKHHMRAKAQELGIPVAEGEVAELAYPCGRRRRDLEPVRAAIERQLQRSARVIVRGASGASGSSTFVVGRGGEDTGGVLRRLAERADNRIYLVEAMVEAMVSPNVQIHIPSDDGPLTCTGITDQRWGRGLTHAGNQLPSSARTVDAMEAWARILAHWMRRQGYTGPVGFDFVEYRDPLTGRPRALLTEVDPRVSGGTYPLALRARLNAAAARTGRPPAPAFVSGTVATRAASFARVKAAIGHLLFDPDRGTGVVPYATGCLEHGRCALVALAGSRLRAAEVYGAAQARLEAA